MSRLFRYPGDIYEEWWMIVSCGWAQIQEGICILVERRWIVEDTQKKRFLETFPCCSLHQSPLKVQNTLFCFASPAKTVKHPSCPFILLVVLLLLIASKCVSISILSQDLKVNGSAENVEMWRQRSEGGLTSEELSGEVVHGSIPWSGAKPED